jgi:O-antigen/teichoic acid export membrane protein
MKLLMKTSFYIKQKLSILLIFFDLNAINNSIFLFLDQILKMTFGFIVGIYMARQNGPDYYGTFGYVLAISTLFTSFSGFGIESIVVRDLLKPRLNLTQYLQTAFWIKTLGGFISLLMSFFIFSIFNLESPKTQILIYIYISISMLQGFEILDLYLQSKTQTILIIKRKLIFYLFSFIIKLILIKNNVVIEWLVASYFIDQLLISVMYYFMIKKVIHPKFNFNFFFKHKLAKNIISKSWPLMFSSFVIIIYMKIDQVMLKFYSNISEVAFYSAALKLSEIWYIIPSIFSIVIFPNLIKARHHNIETFNNLITKCYSFFLWTAIFISICMSFFSKFTIIFIYGNSFLPSVDILLVHIWTSIFVFLGVLSSKYFIIQNLQIYSLYRTFAGALLNIILNFILIPKYGGIGAAYATLVSQFMASYMFNVFTSKTRENFFLQTRSLILPFTRLNK